MKNETLTARECNRVLRLVLAANDRQVRLMETVINGNGEPDEDHFRKLEAVTWERARLRDFLISASSFEGADDEALGKARLSLDRAKAVEKVYFEKLRVFGIDPRVSFGADGMPRVRAARGPAN